MAEEIVPIRLGLTGGDFLTLWAPPWHDGGDEWEGFLGADDRLYGFDTLPELIAFIRSSSVHDLTDHPGWAATAALPVARLVPSALHEYDLVAVPELVAEDPQPRTIARLDAALEMTRSLGQICGLAPVTGFFDTHPALGAVTQVASAPIADSELWWAQIADAIADGWDEVLDALDAVLTVPEVDATAITAAETETDPPTTETAVDTAPAETTDAPAENTPEHPTTEGIGAWWEAVGIDPITIITAKGTYYTLRCYVGEAEEPVFLGRAGTIEVFPSPGALARYLVDTHDHDLAQMSTYPQIMDAATDGTLDVTVTEENIYVLPGLVEDLGAGPEAVDTWQLELAVELIGDIASYCADAELEEAVAPSTPLGWYLSYLLNPHPDRMAPSPPFTAETDAWRNVEDRLESHLTNH
ncbi:primosomal protein [Rhodococcus jostii]|uniref:primosomal protein n=1 Tax=Rhodococcus jostii TaxID=132919 RepID=UPI0036251F14